MPRFRRNFEAKKLKRKQKRQKMRLISQGGIYHEGFLFSGEQGYLLDCNNKSLALNEILQPFEDNYIKLIIKPIGTVPIFRREGRQSREGGQILDPTPWLADKSIQKVAR